MDSDQITLDEIQPYVAIGPSEKYSVTVEKDTFDKGFIIVFILAVILAITLIILSIVYANEQGKFEPPEELVKIPPRLTVGTNLGAALFPSEDVTSMFNIDNGSKFLTQTSCNEAQNTIWVNDRCICKAPYFGPTCSQEKHAYPYLAVGIPNEETLKMNVIDDRISDGKSFNSNNGIKSCSNECDNTPGCHSFIYHQPNMCTLINGDIVIPSTDNISYSYDIDSTLYTKSLDNIKFEDKIFLAKSNANIPYRYWLNQQSDYYIQMNPRTIYTLKFRPEYIIMYNQHYTGIYCLKPFTYDMINTIIMSNSDSCYIHHPYTPLNVPFDWEYKLPIYVIYI